MLNRDTIYTRNIILLKHKSMFNIIYADFSIFRFYNKKIITRTGVGFIFLFPPLLYE